MDKFVTFKKEKTSSGDFIGDIDVFNAIATVVSDNGMICLYGDSGVGKTYIVDLVLKHENFVEVSTLSECAMLSESPCHVLVDCITPDRSIVDHGKKLSLGATIIVARTIEKINFCDCVKLGPMSVENIIKIGKKKFPKISENTLQHLANNCSGNIRNFLFSIQFEGEHDVFHTSKQFAKGLLRGTIDPMEYMNGHSCDHGYIWDMIFTNQTNVDPYISELHSDADIYDSKIYNNNWQLLKYFWISSMVHPIHRMEKVQGDVKPGSAWTKFWNAKMRHKKAKNLPDVGTVHLLKEMCRTLSTDEVVDVLKKYHITSSDMDTINHLAIVNKIKTKKLQEIKKALKV